MKMTNMLKNINTKMVLKKGIHPGSVEYPKYIFIWGKYILEYFNWETRKEVKYKWE